MNVVHLGAESTTVSSGDCEVDIALGYRRVARDCFRHDPPSDADLERAINVIEDELERARPELQQGTAEVRTAPGIARALKGADVESRYQSLVAGPRASAGNDYAAAVVILREMTHHLGLDMHVRA